MRHSLSYAHSDQALLRDPALDHCWDGLVVPGTLATFYFEGTGGFVLTRRAPYLIDPRTPLLQTLDVRRGPPKKSHLELAAIHDPDVVTSWPDDEIARAHWEDGRWPRVVRSVLDFQLTYAQSATAKFDKYNKLLAEAGRRVEEAEAPDPQWLVPPYWAVGGRDDPWWTLTRESIEIATREHGARVTPILASRNEVSISVHEQLIAEMPEGVTAVFCWSSNWSEATATAGDVRDWVRVVSAGRERGIDVRNLYGGYLSVLLTEKGLAGINHGVGYSESRDYRRLSATGAPPTRYYIPILREFMSVPSAQPVIDHLPAAWSCPCPVCALAQDENGRPLIGTLKPEDLKRHFLFARHAEFERVGRSLADELDNLDEVGQWVIDNERSRVLTKDHGERLRGWAASIRQA